MSQPAAKPHQVSQFPLPPRRYYQSIASHPMHPPPLPSSNDSYHMFGRVYSTEHIVPSLEHAGRKRLYDPSAPPCHELRSMNSSLLQLFLKLVEQLCHPIAHESPVQPHQHIIQQIEDTFVNMQHLINVMRPAQAAMDLKTLLDNQTRSRKQTTDNLHKSVKKAWDLIAEAADEVTQPSYQLSPPAAAYLQSLQQPQTQHHPSQPQAPQPPTTRNTDLHCIFDDMMPALPAPPPTPATDLLRNVNLIVNDPNL
ncbi:unnamed protein product [Agarophyton chilense]